MIQKWRGNGEGGRTGSNEHENIMYTSPPASYSRAQLLHALAGKTNNSRTQINPRRHFLYKPESIWAGNIIFTVLYFSKVTGINSGHDLNQWPTTKKNQYLKTGND